MRSTQDLNEINIPHKNMNKNNTGPQPILRLLIRVCLTGPLLCLLQWWRLAPSTYREARRTPTGETPVEGCHEGPERVVQTGELAIKCHSPSKWYRQDTYVIHIRIIIIGGKRCKQLLCYISSYQTQA